MDLYNLLWRPLLFTQDPEKVHNLAVKLISRGLIKEHRDITYTVLEQELFGIKFKNPLGLAAGFDKNAEAVPNWAAAGFGFFEIGTVTLQAQEGNPKPRMFRLAEDQAIINRLGFNNVGARAVAEHLAGARSMIPFGINIGKSQITSLEKAAEEYREIWRVLRGFGAYLVVNVSSPNTPGLRSLQEKEKLKEILTAIRDLDPITPLFVKVAPDLEFTALDEVVEVAIEKRVQGLIATNTTLSREGLRAPCREAGGLSGRPLKPLSDKVLGHLAKVSDGRLFLIGVGGIFSGRDIYDKIALGAHLCQVFTGWVYGGPDMVPRALEELAQLVEREGFKNIGELRGAAMA